MQIQFVSGIEISKTSTFAFLSQILLTKMQMEHQCPAMKYEPDIYNV